MILEATPNMVLEGQYDGHTDITSFYQYIATQDNLIAKASVGLDFANRTAINFEQWVTKNDPVLVSLKEVEPEVLVAIVDNFPIEVIRNYLK